MMISGCSAGGGAERLFSVGGFQDDELAAQGGLQETTDRTLVIHHQYTQIGFGHDGYSLQRER